MDDPHARRAIALLDEALPHFRPLIDELRALFEDELAPAAVFGLLAEETRARLDRSSAADERWLEASATAIELVVTDPDVDAVESVAFGYFETLGPEAMRRLASYLHPAAERLYAQLEAGELDAWPES